MTDKDTARQLVAALVDKFAADYKHYTAPSYNETEVRVQFINPFFEALGWDIADSKGRHEVFHEDYVEVEEAGKKRGKRPDYGFRLNNTTRFFVEAKKPSVNLKDDPTPAFQVRRYGWSARLPVSVLTDFEEFIVYDCRIKPDEEDRPTKGRLRYYTYKEYVEKWDEIYDLFSYEAVQENRLEIWIQETKQRGTVTVDDAFLSEMEEWREALAKNIAKNNHGLTRRQLNMAVQTTIDRIVFLRICEDRGIEPPDRLQSFGRGKDIYANLVTLFKQADQRYNSGLFHFSAEKGREEPDTITPKLVISDKPLKDIITRLYYPSPYAFSVIPADILGQIYERFLGKVIELTSSGGAKVEEKPEVRKAGGVFYTPTYIVEYIVKNTVGKLVEGKTPEQVAKLRILDPACGSGSFLIGAYQFLLDWHLNYYTADGTAKHLKAKRLREVISTAPAGETVPAAVTYALTTDTKKRILLNNIYGVDLDQQAVEVTKLSLLLKVLEGETAATAQPELFAERVLPDLGDNIKWGNSLIGPEYYSGKQLTLFNDEELDQVKTFDWGDKENGFGTIMSAGGFDAIVGNPPYIRIQTMIEWAPDSVAFYKDHYIAASKGNYDIYVIFVEKALSLLSKNGLMGYILPHKFFNAQYGEPLRGIIAKGKHLKQIIHFGHQQIFAKATTYTCLLFLGKSEDENFLFVNVDNLSQWRDSAKDDGQYIFNVNVTESNWNFSSTMNVRLYEKLTLMPIRLGDIAARMSQGIRTSANEVYVLDLIEDEGKFIHAYSKILDREIVIERDATANFLQGREIKPYSVLPSGKALILPYQIKNKNAELININDMRVKFPLAWNYLLENKKYLEAREKGRFKGNDWHVYGRNQNIDLMLLPKILVPDIAIGASFAFDETGHYAFTSGYGIILKSHVRESIKYVLGLLNSKVLDFYLKQVSTPMRGGYFRYFTQFIEQLPIRAINFDDPAEKTVHDRIVKLVEEMLDLHKQLAAATSPQVAKTIQSVIAKTDRDIDQLVYQLYDLTPEEIALVEGDA